MIFGAGMPSLSLSTGSSTTRFSSSGKSSAMMPHMALWPSRLRMPCVKARAPDRVVAPRIAAGHRDRPAGRLQAPLGPAHEAARGVGLVELQRVQVLAPHAVRAAEVFVEQADDRAEGMHHQPAADEAGRVRQAARKLAAGREQQQPRRADAAGGEDRDVGRLKMLGAAAIDVRRAGHQAAAVRLPAAARARR